MGKRKSRSAPINASYLQRKIDTLYGCSVLKLVEQTEKIGGIRGRVSANTVRKALRGEGIDEPISRRLCKGTGIKLSELRSLGDQLSLHSIKERLGYEEPNVESSSRVPESEPNQASEESSASVASTDDTSRPKIIAFVSIKGGVGKTTLAINLAVELAQKLRVALVDVDLFTFGATRWFQNSIHWNDAPLTFLDLALSEDDLIAEKKLLSTFPIKAITANKPKERLHFIPAYTTPNSVAKGVTAPPILIDWSVDVARDAINRAIDRLSQMKFDVIVLDSHPGFINLTDAVCSQVDCNILVSDYDSSTLHANWLLAWQMEHRNLIREQSTTSNEHSKHKPIWRIAVNRIPSLEASKQCSSHVEDSRQSALSDWKQCIFDSPLAHRIETDFKEPVLMLPDMENLRLENIDTSDPTSTRLRGGNCCVLATRYLIRRLVLERVLINFNSAFPYAALDNHAAHNALSKYIESYPLPWQPTARGFQPWMSIPLIASIVLFFIDMAIMATVPTDVLLHQLLPNIALGIVSLLLLLLGVYALLCVVKDITNVFNRFGFFVTASGIESLSSFERFRLFDQGESAVGNMKMIFQVLWMLGFVPGLVIGLVQIRGLGSPWEIIGYLATAFLAVCVFWKVPGKTLLPSRVLGLFSYVARSKFSRMFRKNVSEYTQKDDGN